MNLSVIRRFIMEGDMSRDAFLYLLNCRGECEWLDFKEQLFLENDNQLCDFTRDALALKNVGGGYIIVGVKDKTWQPVGLQSRLPYDSKMLRDKVRRGSGVDLDIDIVHHTTNIAALEAQFALVMVRASKKKSKRRTPTLVVWDFCRGKPFGLLRGEIYFRKGDSTVKVGSESELDSLLDALESQTEQDAIIASVNVSPFAIQDGLYHLLEKGYDTYIGRESLRRQIKNAIMQDPRIWIINVHGPGGVGKSALVNWAVYEFYRERQFEVILQLTGKETVLTPTGILKASRSLYSLENLLEQILDLFQEKPVSSLEKNKALAVEILSTWKTLLVLDNLETVMDGRVLNFVQALPLDTKTKVLITSRQKTGAWELPIPVNEMNVAEVKEFLKIRSKETGIEFPIDNNIALKVWNASGGLPLAIQWIIGSCKILGTIAPAIEAVGKKDSPVLEFSFGNIWKILSSDAKAILAVMSIFEEPPTIPEIAVATEFNFERIEKALEQLIEVTLVNKNTNLSDGRARFVSLPITLTFARHQFESMGDFETQCRQRHNKFTEQMKLLEIETSRFQGIFDRYGLDTDNEKRASILCQRGQSEVFIGNTENADALFKQARDLAPQSSYIYAISASYELARARIGQAEEFIKEACRRANRKTGGLCFTIKAQIFDVQRDHLGIADALSEAVRFEPDNIIIRHQYGVALSKAGQSEKAIEQFDHIIAKEKVKIPPQGSLLMAMKTKMINLKRLDKIIELQKNLNDVDDIIKTYPHLADQAKYFEEFR